MGKDGKSKIARSLDLERRVFAEFKRTRTSVERASDDWVVTFTHENLQTQLGKPVSFSRDEQIWRLYDEAGDEQNLQAESLLKMGIQDGHGAFWLRLKAADYQQLLAETKTLSEIQARHASKR